MARQPFAVVALGLLSTVVLASRATAFNIVLDPGHGGQDPGAVGCSLEEHEINLDVALRLKTLLEEQGQQVSVTRSANTSVLLAVRADFANSRGADRFASIHSNAADAASANGTETFCHTSASASSIDMRDKIQHEMIAAWGLTDRGSKTADFSVLRETVMPATLSELGFVSNCGIDATFLADNVRRGEAAQAHLTAIADHLGFAIDDTIPTNGELTGVVFEDVGVASDQSHRIPGATLTVVGRDDVVTAGVVDAEWSFQLPAGSYSVRAEAGGFVSAEQSCEPLDAGGIIFCSIGLLPVLGGEGEGEALGEGEGEDEGANGVQRVIIRNRPGVLGGCTCTSSGDAGACVVVLATLSLLRGRRRQGLIVPMVALGLATPALAFTVDSVPLLTIEVGSQTSDERVVFQGVAASVTPSPSGRQLLISDDHYEGLTVIDVDGGARNAVSTSARAGFRARWADEGNVAHRIPQAPFGGQPLRLLDSKTGRFRGPWFEHATRALVQTNDDVILLGDRVDQAGHLAQPVQLSPSDDRCFAPQMVNDVVVFQCLQSGVWLVRPGALGVDRFRLGDGAKPSLAHDGQTLVFLLSSDDGHVTTQADLVVVDLQAKPPTAIVLQTARIEGAPGVSDLHPDGSRTLGFSVDNDVTIATLGPTR